MKTGVSWFLFWVLFTVCLTFSEERPELQPDDVDGGQFDDLTHGSPTLCVRECRREEPPRLCYYKFHLEFYIVLSGACGLCPVVKSDCYKPQCVTADGFERPILTANRRLPGPSIQVCKGDTIVVDVKNQMPGSSTSIHWHGIRQRLTPWMDGVAMVTQCPILEGQTFRYRFIADEAGTYFWHSHDGQQKVDGLVGSLIVREPDSSNPLRQLYDLDLPSHTVLVQDWMHTSANDRLPGGLRKLKERGQTPVSYLINGRGVQLRSLIDLGKPFKKKTPLAKFHVHKGFRYRFRIIGGTCLSCPFRISIQDHKLLVITIDDNPIEPVEVDSVVLFAGERYDVVIEANQPLAAYWILVRGLGECLLSFQAAVLLYEGSSTSKPYLPHWSSFFGIHSGYTMNPRNSKCNDASLSKGICVSQLQSLLPNPPQVSRIPDLRIVMTFNFYFFNNEELFRSNTFHKYFVPQVPIQLSSLMNNVSNMMPPSPLLTQLWDIPPSMFCQEEMCQDQSSVCECINLLKVPLGSVVEIILVDTALPTPVGVTHPFHIHGHDFFVLEEGIFKGPWSKALPNLEERLLEEGRLVTRFLPSKDTVSVPAAGYAVVRLLANNPGFWLFHCHFAYHLSTGMSTIIQVGELSDVPPPPRHFPRCHQFLPPLEH